MPEQVRVESEFAPLQSVVLACSEFAAGSDVDPDSPDFAFLTADAKRDLEVLRGKDLREAFPERQAAWEREREAFRLVLEEYGVRVDRPRPLTDAEKQATGRAGYANFFVRDPWFTIGEHVIEGSLRLAHRRREVLASRPVLRERVLPSQAGYIAVPQPELSDDDTAGSGPFLEGGDVLVLGDHVFVGESGLASDRAGFEWLRKLLRPHGYTVEHVALEPKAPHLDCALGLVRDGLLIVCEDFLAQDLPERLASRDRITVSEDEGFRLATNGLPLAPDVYVTDPEFTHIGRQLERRGITVRYVDFAITRSLGGAFRCSTQALQRTVA